MYFCENFSRPYIFIVLQSYLHFDIDYVKLYKYVYIIKIDIFIAQLTLFINELLSITLDIVSNIFYSFYESKKYFFIYKIKQIKYRTYIFQM